MSLFDRDILEKGHPEIHLLSELKDIVRTIIPGLIRHYNSTTEKILSAVMNEVFKRSLDTTWYTPNPLEHTPYKVTNYEVHKVGWIRYIPVYCIVFIYNINDSGIKDKFVCYAGINGIIDDPKADPNFQISRFPEKSYEFVR